MRKIVCLVMCLLVVLSFAGCKENDSKGNSSTQSSVSSQSESEKPDESSIENKLTDEQSKLLTDYPYLLQLAKEITDVTDNNSADYLYADTVAEIKTSVDDCAKGKGVSSQNGTYLYYQKGNSVLANYSIGISEKGKDKLYWINTSDYSVSPVVGLENDNQLPCIQSVTFAGDMDLLCYYYSATGNTFFKEKDISVKRIQDVNGIYIYKIGSNGNLSLIKEVKLPTNFNFDLAYTRNNSDDVRGLSAKLSYSGSGQLDVDYFIATEPEAGLGKTNKYVLNLTTFELKSKP